jgi:signal transduction histidine kinase
MTADVERSDSPEAGRLLALGSLVPGVVHELNNALLGLLGMLELARADAEGPVVGRLEIAQQAGEEIRAIASVLGALAREPLDDAGPVDACEIVREAIESAEALNLVRGLELTQVVAPEPLDVPVPAAQLRQAVLLLLGGAFARSGRQGPLLVEALGENGSVRIAVRHSGAGAVADGDPGTGHLDQWAQIHLGSFVVESTRLTLTLPRA